MQKLKSCTILYIEDDEITRENLSQYLKRVCKKLLIAKDGEEGFSLFEEYFPDIIITDIEMPKQSGIEMAKKIRKISLSTQIIITTAFTNPEHLMEAVNLKLTKYIIKPISLTKVTKALKECEEFLKEELKTKKYFNKNCFYDTYTKELINDSQIIPLSKTERALLETLLKNHPSSTSYEAIEADVYDFNSSKNAIKLLIKALRVKLGKENIINISGYGYNIKIENINE